MASTVGIVNDALAMVGEPRIASLDEGSDVANTCRDLYDTQLEALLRLNAWNFATMRAKLARLNDAPAFGYQYAYQLPTGWLRTISAHDNDAGYGALDYRAEGRQLLTDAEDVYIRYVGVVDDPNYMPPDFRKALSASIAELLAMQIKQSNTMAERIFEQLRRVYLPRAMAADGQDDRPDRVLDGSFVTSRNR